MTLKGKVLVACAILAGAAMVWATSYVTADRGALLARVGHLENVLTTRQGLSEEEARTLLTRLDSLAVPAPTTTVNQLLLRLAEVEQTLPYPVVSAREAKDLVGKEAAVFGTVTRTNRASSGHYFVDIAEFQLVWFNAPTDFALQEGQGVVAVGTIATYQGRPQIVLTSHNQLTIGK